MLIINRPINFVKEVQSELTKVVWPTRAQTVKYTILVISVAVTVGLFLGGLDYLLTILTNKLIGLISK